MFLILEILFIIEVILQLVFLTKKKVFKAL